MIKNPEEIEYIREACKITSDTLIMLKEFVKPGVSTLYLDKLTEDYIRS